MDLDRLVKKIHTSRKTVLELLNDRGYPTDKYNNYTINEISNMIKTTYSLGSGLNPLPGPLDMLLTREDGRKIYIKYNLDISRLTAVVKTMNHEIFDKVIDKKDTLLLLVAGKFNINTSTVTTYIDEMYYSNGCFIQMFSVADLLFNRSKHEIVPKHRIISEKEKRQVMKRYNMSSVDNFPMILKEDPIAKYHGCRPGDICEITSNSGISGTYIKYRHCISSV